MTPSQEEQWKSFFKVTITKPSPVLWQKRQSPDLNKNLSLFSSPTFSMPGMDGFELIRNARMIQPRLLTIMITGFPAEEVKCKAKQERVDGFFSKPVNWDELHTLLDTLSGSERVQYARKGIGLYRPERILLAIILFISIIFGVQLSKAQPPFHPQNEPMLRRDSHGTCWESSDLVLTEDADKGTRKSSA